MFKLTKSASWAAYLVLLRDAQWCASRRPHRLGTSFTFCQPKNTCPSAQAHPLGWRCLPCPPEGCPVPWCASQKPPYRLGPSCTSGHPRSQHMGQWPSNPEGEICGGSLRLVSSVTACVSCMSVSSDLNNIHSLQQYTHSGWSNILMQLWIQRSFSSTGHLLKVVKHTPTAHQKRTHPGWSSILAILGCPKATEAEKACNTQQGLEVSCSSCQVQSVLVG